MSRVRVSVGEACGQLGIALSCVPSYMYPAAVQGVAALGLCVLFLVSGTALTVGAERDRAASSSSMTVWAARSEIVGDQAGRTGDDRQACRRLGRFDRHPRRRAVQFVLQVRA